MRTMLTASMVSALRGAPITILVLLMIERKPLAMEYIRRHTRYSQNTISDSMALLADYGMVIQTARYVYQIADGVQQLPLMAMELDSSEEPEMENVIDGEFRSQNLRAEDTPQSNLSEVSEIRSQKMRPNSTNKPPDDSRSQKFRARSQNLRPATLASSSLNLESRNLEKDLARGQQIQKNLECLDRYGVREPARTRLAHLEHVTEPLIDTHCQQSPNISLAIYRIEHNWSMDESKKPDAPVFIPDNQAEQRSCDEPLPVPDIWIHTIDHIMACKSLSRAQVHTWLVSTPTRVMDGELHLLPKNGYAKEWLSDHLESIQDALIQVSESPINIRVIYEQ